MSFRAVVWALTQDIPPREQLILIHLSDFYNDDLGYAWMHQGTLAKRSNYSRVTVNHALKKLEEELKLISSTQTHYADGKRAGKRYTINFHNGQPIDYDTQDGHVKNVNSGTDKVKDLNNLSKESLHDRVKHLNNKNVLTRTSYKEHKDMSAGPTIDLDQYTQAWNDNCGTLPPIRVLNDWRKRKLREHIKLHGQDALHIFTQATKQVAQEEWWTTNNYGIDSLLRNKITTYAEKHQATKQPTKITFPTLDF